MLLPSAQSAPRRRGTHSVGTLKGVGRLSADCHGRLLQDWLAEPDTRKTPLTAADILTVDLQLQVGNVQQSVEVNATPPVLQTQSQAVSSLVTNQQITEIPLNQRIFTQVLQLMPGATSTTPNPQASGTYGLLASNAYSINGSQSSNNSYLIDGVHEIDDAWFDGKEKVLITAGASAPEEVVEECVTYLQNHFGATVENRVVREEHVSFPLPRELRVVAG